MYCHLVKICPESAHSLTFGFFIFVSSTQESERELDSIDVETAKLQRHLEVCPKDGASAAVDETSFVESIQQLDQSRKRSRDLLLLTQASVAGRLQHWKLFEDSVNRVLCLIKRLNYARNMASLKGSVDLQRLLAAKQSIEVRNATPYNSNGKKYKCKCCGNTTWNLFTSVCCLSSRGRQMLPSHRVSRQKSRRLLSFDGLHVVCLALSSNG